MRNFISNPIKFNETVKLDGGRYSVQWPWREEIPDLPENYDFAGCDQI